MVIETLPCFSSHQLRISTSPATQLLLSPLHPPPRLFDTPCISAVPVPQRNESPNQTSVQLFPDPRLSLLHLITGQQIQVQGAPGQTYNMIVPPGATPGSVVNFQVCLPTTSFSWIFQPGFPLLMTMLQVGTTQQRSDDEITQLMGVAARGVVAATVLTGKAVYGALSYAHQKGWGEC
jgi:hypothetical protein